MVKLYIGDNERQYKMAVLTVINVETKKQVKPNKMNCSFSLTALFQTKEEAKKALLSFEKEAAKALELVNKERLQIVPSIQSSYTYGKDNKRKKVEVVRYSVSFLSDSVDNASEFNDAVNMLEGKEYSNISFYSTDLPKYEDELLSEAVKQAKDKFSKQATMLGVDLTGVEVLSWEIGNRNAYQPVRRMMAMSLASESVTTQPEVEMKVSDIDVSVNISVTFGRK